MAGADDDDDAATSPFVGAPHGSPRQAWAELDKSAPFKGCGLFCSCIPSGSVGVVQKFGRFHGYMEPGLNSFCPLVHTVMKVSLAARMLECRTECKTKDNATLAISTAVTYRVDKDMVKQAVFDIDDPESQIRATVDNVVRSTIPCMDLEATFSSKADLANRILSVVKSTMQPHGYMIVSALVTDVSPERELLEAMNAQLAARMHVETAREEGEAAKILKIKAAEAEAQARYLSGRGVAQMRQAIADGMKTAVTGLVEGGLPTQQAVETMILTQYIDTLRDFALNPNKSAILLPPGKTAQLCDGGVEGDVMGGQR
eukprot:CAMPEP_0115354630 /NCGR_PEP_ID=MMETSP0270-20121206/98688_1 /TAXON_ID=71861 /ORGANISM="Scrippsiella trochoidea, Strain CCMP3099" /LENGTH=314 /DNA_ID=CAMNT_0002776975 /DNA_START=21 /DNA_END=962 /DNA_ORIENTATION=-